MSARHVLRAIGWSALCVAAPVLLGAALGRRGAPLGVLAAVIATVAVTLWLPRAAHRAFEAGRFGRAGRRYRVVAALAAARRRERAAQLSRAACDLAAGRLARAQALLARFEPAGLDVSERVVWLNNVAWAALDGGGDPASALALVDEATALRPDVPAVQHTRARALLAVGRVDDAIAVLDAMRAGGELAPHLESIRCAELADAWDRKGHAAYASDYRGRARLLAS